MNFPVPVAKEGIGVYGLAANKLEQFFEVKKVNYSFFEAFPAGFNKSLETLESYWLQMKLIFSGKVKTSESLGSVFSIANMFGGEWRWDSFWSMTALFSLILALMNILPIPALDGGHALLPLSKWSPAASRTKR